MQSLSRHAPHRRESGGWTWPSQEKQEERRGSVSASSPSSPLEGVFHKEEEAPDWVS